MPATEPERLFQSALRQLRPLFKERGFRCSSQNFILESGDSWVIVNFQKSRWSSPDEKTFYINVAATLKRFLDFDGEPTKAPAYYACAWRWRAEQFGPDPKVQQWTIRDESSLESVMDYLRRLLGHYVVPAALTMTTEGGLLDRQPIAHLGYPQLKVASVIFAANGDRIKLAQTLSELIGRFGKGIVASPVADHLQKLRAAFPAQMDAVE